MAIVTNIGDSGVYIYRSVNGLGIPDEEKEFAQIIDQAIEQGLSSLNNEIKKMKLGKEKVIIYWKFGHLIRKIFEDYKVLNSELSYFFMNVRFRAKPYDLFLAEDRGGRSHILYCYRLGKYPYNKAVAMKWSEWSYLLDSPGGDKFDDWFGVKLDEESKKLTRPYVRFLAQTINAILKNFDISDFEKDELERCYEGAWNIALYVVYGLSDISVDDAKKTVKIKIGQDLISLSQLISGEKSAQEYRMAICGYLE